MQLRNDINSRNLLNETVLNYYKSKGRHASRFSADDDAEWDGFNAGFLVDRKHVVKYNIIRDRGFWLGSLTLAIGPHYFSAADFWSYKDFERFKMDATTEAIEFNLALLDEFLRGDANR